MRRRGPEPTVSCVYCGAVKGAKGSGRLHMSHCPWVRGYLSADTLPQYPRFDWPIEEGP